MEERESVESVLSRLNELKDGVEKALDEVSGELEIESKECEIMRVKYEHLWTQAPSASLTKSLRQDLKSHFGALEAAATSDQQVLKLWDSVKADISLLLSPEVEGVFRESTDSHLLDLDVGSEVSDAQERAKIRQFVDEIEERLGRLNKIAKERMEVLKDLKDKVRITEMLTINTNSLLGTGAIGRRVPSPPSQPPQYRC